MPELTIVANITARPESVELVQAELEKLIPITLKEEGCVRYDLHRDDDDPHRFMFYETWTSRDLWQIHMNAPHLAEYMKATEGAVVEFTVRELTQL